MEKYEVWILAGVFIIMFLFYRYTDKYVKRLPVKTVKRLNSISFAIAIVAGVAWYLYHNTIAMIVTLAAMLFFFVFYDYKREDADSPKPTP